MDMQADLQLLSAHMLKGFLMIRLKTTIQWELNENNSILFIATMCICKNNSMFSFFYYPLASKST